MTHQAFDPGYGLHCLKVFTNLRWDILISFVISIIVSVYGAELCRIMHFMFPHFSDYAHLLCHESI